jgi:hypothetical protein
VEFLVCVIVCPASIMALPQAVCPYASPVKEIIAIATGIDILIILVIHKYELIEQVCFKIHIFEVDDNIIATLFACSVEHALFEISMIDP